MKVIKNHPKLVFFLFGAIVTCYSFINMGNNKDIKPDDFVKVSVTSSNSGDVVFDADFNQYKLKQQKTPYEIELKTSHFNSVFHQVGGDGKMFVKVEDNTVWMTSDDPITVILKDKEKWACFGLQEDAYADLAKSQKAIAAEALSEANHQRSIAEEQKKIAEAYIDTARVLKYIAIAQTDSATRFKLMAAEALEQVKELKKKLEEK